MAERILNKLKKHPVRIVVGGLSALIIGMAALFTAMDSLSELYQKYLVPDEVVFEREGYVIKYSGGDGSSTEQAIVITGGYGSGWAVAAEYYWLEQVYPGYQKNFQATYRGKPQTVHLKMIDHSSGKSKSAVVKTPDEALKRYDVIKIETGGLFSSELEIHFDYTDFYYKPSGVLPSLIHVEARSFQEDLDRKRDKP